MNFSLPHLKCIKASNFTSSLGAIPCQMGDWLSCTQPEVKFDTKIMFSFSTQEQHEDLIKQTKNSVIFTNAKITSDLKQYRSVTSRARQLQNHNESHQEVKRCQKLPRQQHDMINSKQY